MLNPRSCRSLTSYEDDDGAQKATGDDEVSSDPYSIKFLATLGTIIKGSVKIAKGTEDDPVLYLSHKYFKDSSGVWKATYAKPYHRVAVLFRGGYKDKHKIQAAIAVQLFTLRHSHDLLKVYRTLVAALAFDFPEPSDNGDCYMRRPWAIRTAPNQGPSWRVGGT